MELQEVLQAGVDRGLVGPGFLSDHINHAVSYTRLIPSDAERCLDLGSGNGLPGLVLAEADERRWTLLDAANRRCEFLKWAVNEMGLADRVDVVWSRAEIGARVDGLRETFDVVVARSFGPPATTAECSVGYLRVGGTLVVSDHPAADRWPEDGVKKLGLELKQRVEEPSMLSLVKNESLDEWPRRDGQPGQKPLWGTETSHNHS